MRCTLVPLTRVPSRASIQQLELMMLELPQLVIRTTHYLADGLYAREIFIPAGTLLTGKIHRREHLNVVSKGKIQVWTESGMQEVCAPFTMVSRPGTKRVGLAIEDTVWTTIHSTSIKGSEVTAEVLAALEEELIDTMYQFIEEEVTPCLGSQQQL